MNAPVPQSQSSKELALEEMLVRMMNPPKLPSCKLTVEQMAAQISASGGNLGDLSPAMPKAWIGQTGTGSIKLPLIEQLHSKKATWSGGQNLTKRDHVSS